MENQRKYLQEQLLRLDQLSPVTKAPKGFGDTPLKPSNDKKWRLSSESESSQSESEEEWKRRAASKATISEATQILQTLEEDVRRKEAEIAALQAAMEKSKQEASKFDLNSCNVSSCENLRKSIEDTHNSRFLSTHYHCYHFCQHAIITPNQPNRQKKKQQFMENQRKYLEEQLLRLDNELDQLSSSDHVAATTEKMYLVYDVRPMRLPLY